MDKYGRLTHEVMKLLNVNGTKLNRTDKFIFFTLLVKANKNGVALIGNRLLAAISGLDVRSVQRSVNKLKKLGLINSEKIGKYIIQEKYLYKKGGGFGIVKLDVLLSDLSLNAKLLYVINCIAGGKDRSNWYKSKDLMKFIAISTKSYSEAMKELVNAKILKQSTNYERDANGISHRKPNDKEICKEEQFILTYNRIDSFSEKSDKTESHKTTNEPLNSRQKNDLQNVKTTPIYKDDLQVSLTSSFLQNTYTTGENIFTPDETRSVLKLDKSFVSSFSDKFNIELFLHYDSQHIHKIEKLFRGICDETENRHWKISTRDFKLLSNVVSNLDGYEHFGNPIEQYVDFIATELIPAGRNGESLSYWLSDGLYNAFSANMNAAIVGLEFQLDR